jgi:transcriptional regulator PpsR
VLDGNGKVLEVRARDRELLKSIRREWRDKAWVDIVTVESRDKVQALLQGAMQDQDAESGRQVNHPLKGVPDLPVLYHAVRVSGVARTPAAARIVAFGRDLRDTVTLQRRLLDAQQSMERDYWRFREAETRYRHLFQASSEAVLIVDGTSLRIVEANPAAQALAGARAGKAVGAPIASLFEPTFADALSTALAAARSLGKHESLVAALAGSGLAVSVSATAFRHEQSSFLLVRLAPRPVAATSSGRRSKSAASGNGFDAQASASIDLSAAFVRNASDAMAFTDAHGRVVSVNRSFARLAQLSGDDQARGEPLDRWLGRTGVELAVLLANLRDGGAPGLFSTELRGELGLRTEVEVAASALEPAGAAAFAFSVRDVGRRLAPAEGTLPRVPASAKQLTELVGRVPLKQIVAETSDLIERLSIEAALQMTRDNRALAAQLLGLSRQSLYVKLRRFGIGDLPEHETS